MQSRDEFVARYLAYYGGPTEYFCSESPALRCTKASITTFALEKSTSGEEPFRRGTFKRLSVLLPESVKQRFNWPD